MPAPTASAKLLDPVLQIAQHSRQDLQGLLAAVQLEEIEKDKPGARIPAANFNRLLDELGQRSGNDRIALRIGEATQPRMLGSIGFLMATAPDLQSAFQELIDYLPLLCEGIHLQMEQKADGTHLLVELENIEERRSAEWFMACLLNWPRWLSGKQIPALSIELIYPPPDNPGAYERFFASEVKYNADHNRLLIPNSYLKLPCLDANEEMHRLHREFADNLLSTSGREGALVAQVKSLIRHGLTDAQGGVRREKIAASLNLSLRTLQRKLGNLNTNFQDLYDQTRKELALQQIQKGGISFGELSFMLGFSNQSAFQKAFKRWMGVPPSQYREKTKPKTPITAEESRPRTLADLIQQQGVSLPQFFPLALQLVAAVQKLHKQGDMAHDLYPNHIAIENSGSDIRLSLIDPNPLLAVKALERFRYLAPENSGLTASESDHRADLYTLGCIFYEMISGQPPYLSEDGGELLRAHLSADLPPFGSTPQPLAAIVTKLLSPAVDNRYQSCHGVHADLLAAQQRLLGNEEGSEPTEEQPFVAARHDTPDRLVFPHKLYGRQHPLEQLQQWLPLAGQSQCKQVLISAPAGMGKSTLVNYLRPALLERDGLFISGKFDPLQRQRPYSAFVQALQQLVRQKLAGPKGEFQRWKRQLLQIAGSNIRLLTGMIPEIEFISASDSLFPSNDPVELEQRVPAAFIALLRSVSSRPLLLFLDDMQWIDSASLELYRTLCQQSQAPLLIVGAYRNDELELSHPLHALLPEQKQSKHCLMLELPALQSEHTRQMIADIFHQQGSEPISLAGWLHRKTQGNPFFIRRYIQQLHQKRWIYFDGEHQCWRWKEQVFEDQTLPEDIRGLVEYQISKLPPMTQTMLSWGAALGNSFELSTISKASGEPLARVAIHLWPALQEGLVVNLGGETQSTSYRFLHDHIRQNAYRRIKRDERRQMHRSIGTIFLREYSRTEKGGKIYDLVNHLNLAYPLFDDNDNRLELIELNLKAAGKAIAASAFKPAAGFLRHAENMVQHSDWETDTALCTRLYLELARAEYLSGDFNRADTLYAIMERRFSDPIDLARKSLLQSQQYLLQDKYQPALTAAFEGLDKLDQALPHSREALRQQLQRLAPQFEQQSQLNIDTLPAMAEAQRITMELLQLLSQIAERHDNPLLASCALARMMELSISDGHSPQLPLALAGYGYLASWTYGDNRQGQDAARQSLALIEKSDSRNIAAKTRFLNGSRICHWQNHLNDSLPLLDSSQEQALESGDWFTAAMALQVSSFNRCILGQPLDRINQQAEADLTLLQQINNPHITENYQHSIGQFGQQLRQTADHYQAASTDLPWATLATFVSAYLLQQRNIWPELLAQEQQLESQLGGYFATTEMLFIAALMRLELCRNMPQQQQHSLLKEITYTETRMELWARDCPQNFAHRQALIAANRCWLQGRLDQAMQYFEQAIDEAESQGFLYHQAMANEHYASFWKIRGSNKMSDYLMKDAKLLYQRWGAIAKLEKLAI